MIAFVKLFQLMVAISLLFAFPEIADYYGGDDHEPSSELSNNNAHNGLDQDRYVTMKSTGLKVHYRIIGEGPIDVVFIPGWTNPLTVYTKQFDYFREKARCIYIDLPGSGLSDSPTPNTPLAPIADGPEYTMELMADAVYAVVRKEGLPKFVGIGFSMGAVVLGMFERNYPGMIYKLVTLDGSFNPWPLDEPKRSDHIAKREDTYKKALLWDETVKRGILDRLIPPDLVGEDEEKLKEWGIYFIKFPSDVMANTGYHGSSENAHEPVGWMYPKLCLYQNPNPDMDAVNLIYPNSTVHSFPGGGHAIHWVFHEEINPLIWDFIRDRPEKK